MTKAYHLPYKFKGNKEDKDEVKKEGKKVEEGDMPEEEKGKEGGEGRVGRCQEGSNDQ